MKSRVIAIGDIHGSHIAFSTLLSQIDLQQDDTLVVLGDCVDRGPGSYDVIERLLRLREECRLVALLGNHEEMMLDHLDGRKPRFDWLPFGGRQTLESYERAGIHDGIGETHRKFIRSWRDYFQYGSYFFSHGAYDYRLPLKDQNWQQWRWHSLRTSVPPSHVSGLVAIVGHTALKDAKILDLGHLVCIDTYCWGGGWLTAIDVTTGQLWQTHRDGYVNEHITHVPLNLPKPAQRVRNPA